MNGRKDMAKPDSPLTPQEVDEIKKQYHATNHSPSLFSYSQTIKHIPRLVAEIESTQEELGILREIAEKFEWQGYDDELGHYCTQCHMPKKKDHTDGCLHTKLKKLR